jgi:hypothetical protein
LDHVDPHHPAKGARLTWLELCRPRLQGEELGAANVSDSMKTVLFKKIIRVIHYQFIQKIIQVIHYQFIQKILLVLKNNSGYPLSVSTPDK